MVKPSLGTKRVLLSKSEALVPNSSAFWHNGPKTVLFYLILTCFTPFSGKYPMFQGTRAQCTQLTGKTWLAPWNMGVKQCLKGWKQCQKGVKGHCFSTIEAPCPLPRAHTQYHGTHHPYHRSVRLLHRVSAVASGPCGASAGFFWFQWHLKGKQCLKQ